LIYLAALDSVVGKEIAKTRPVAVISNDKNIGNRKSTENSPRIIISSFML
jgi:mRNA-degrading endonuclease toxin of MazEF toxin-antitoxin module